MVQCSAATRVGVVGKFCRIVAAIARGVVCVVFVFGQWCSVRVGVVGKFRTIVAAVAGFLFVLCLADGAATFVGASASIVAAVADFCLCCVWPMGERDFVGAWVNSVLMLAAASTAWCNLLFGKAFHKQGHN